MPLAHHHHHHHHRAAKERMISPRAPTRWMTGFIAVIATSMLISSCGETNDSQKAASASPQATAPSPPIQPSTPATTPAAPSANNAETAKASDEPMKAMSKSEEAATMPRPGQANDHSTLAKDPKR